jgi:hypothetical protein
MTYFRSEAPHLPSRFLVRFAALAIAMLLAAPSAPGAGGSDGNARPGPQCGVDGLAASAGEFGRPFPAIDASIPGWWRHELAFEGPHRRVPGTLSVLPQGPAPEEVSTEGRWVEGYRPATKEAWADFEAWKARQNSAQAGGDGAETPRSPSSNYAANLMRGERVRDVPEEPIQRIVRTEEYPVSRIDVRDIVEVEAEEAKPKGPADDYHHGSSMTWNEYLAVKELAKTTPWTSDAQDAATGSPLAPGPAGVGFDAIPSNITSVPPDPIMAAGPTHLVGIVNRRYQVWDKTGTPLVGDIALDTFFDGVSNCDGAFDVFVDYDEALDRFVMGGMVVEQTAGTDSYLCVAATATNDPTGAWHRFSFRADANATDTWIDFPHMGIGLDAVYIGGNMFADSGGLDHVRVFALDKDDLYDGTPLTVAEANLGSLFFTAQPVKIHGFYSGGWPAPGTPHHFIAHDAGGNSRIWRWGDPFVTDPVIYGTIAEENFGGVPPNAPERGGTTGDLNDSGSAKWLDAEYRGGKLWTTRNVACNLDGGDSESCIDWIQVDVSGPSPVLEQQQIGGAYGSADEFRYYPDIAVDRNHSIAIGYTKSSWSIHTEVWVTGREVDDASGTLQSETLQRAGLGNYVDGAGCQGSCDRWGDYTGMTVDPDGCTFWYLGQYSDGGYFNWGTHVGSFRFESCSLDSSLHVDKGSVTCDDSITLTVTDSTPVDAATVSAQTTVTTTGGDSETIPPGSWAGSDCTGDDCGTWTATLTVSDETGSNDDGTVNVHDGETISAVYLDPHMGHDDHTRNVAVTCRTRLEDGGYLVDGGCEQQQGGETYRDYMDGGELISYTFGIFNPETAPDLTDVRATLSISGPATDKVTIFNPTVDLGSMDRGALTAPVFQLYIDPGIDAAGFRMSEHDFSLGIVSAADGFTVPQVLTQSHLLQADDNIVAESQCWNFESGDQGFVNEVYYYDYACTPPDCDTYTWITTTVAPWTHGGGCGSETRDDHPEMACDTAGSHAFKPNADPAACNLFDQSTNTLTNDVLYSPIFGPAHTGTAANAQPWYYNWLYAEWFYRSNMISGEDPAMGAGFLWDDDYQGVADPGPNEVNTFYPFFYGYIYYANQDWDSGMAWDPANPPANLDGIAFGAGSGGEALPDRQWRMAVQVYDTDITGNPLATPATQGLALDNLNLVYEQYHTDEQVGACSDPPAVVSVGRFSYLECPSDDLAVSVLDANAGGVVRVTVVSAGTGDSETFPIPGAGPYFAGSLPYSTAGGPNDNDGTLFVTPSDLVFAIYEAGGTEDATFAVTRIVCEGEDVAVDGIVGLSDNGDGDSYPDTNETVDLSIRIRNNTDRPLENVRVVIATDDPTVDCITKDTATLGTIAAGGGTASNDLVTDPFTFKVSNSAECADPLTPPTATFQVMILADDFAGPLAPQELTVLFDLNDLPGTITFSEDFSTESVGFFHQLGPGDDDGAAFSPDGAACSPYVDEFFWRATGGNPGGGYFCWQNPTDDFPNGIYSDLNDSALYSPVLKIGATNTRLTFDHEYLFGYSGSYRVDGTRVDYRLNGGSWQKLTTLPYDGSLIWNTYCNPLCNGADLGRPCFTEDAQAGENIFNQLDQGAVSWEAVSGDLTGLTVGDQIQFRWRVGSMNTSAYGISTQGGYGLDNVSVTNVVEQACDAAVNPDTGCGVIFDHFGNLVEICGDGDTLVEPTERWSVDVTLRNSATAESVNLEADLAVSAGSSVPATVTGNPGSYGTLAADGGTGTASYELIVGSGATCINDILFDVVNIVDDGGYHSDQRSAFTVQVGGISSTEIATQSVNPLVASGDVVSSPLLPALTTEAPAYTATVTYDFIYNNVAPEEVATADTDPLVVENTVSTTTLSPSFTLDDEEAVSAVVDWTSFTHERVVDCARVFLRTPNGIDFTLKDVGEDVANPYDVLAVYQNAIGGPGQYRIGVEELGGGQCKREAILTGATMTVIGPTSAGSWTYDAKVSLWDGASEHVLKGFGESDTGSYDVRSIYNAAGPGIYELRLEDSGGGEARLSAGSMTVSASECDLGCTGIPAPAPPMADGLYGSGITLGKGAGPDEIVVTIDNATCSATRAVVVYGDVGDYGGYQGAVDSGCDLGTGPTSTVVHAGGDVWFNVIWVNEDDAAGHPGFDSMGPRSWDAAGLCGVASDDPADAVCD